ncbi:MAG: acetyl-CoA C-acetyltransferase [Deltaproteobacteria bacterium]|nr:acetyl-CoA C-acetyltransferase [Deltaproteobacteria bacterium]
MQKPVIVAATRTAIGTFGGTLAQTPAPELAAIVIREALRRAGNLPGDQVDEVVLGNVLAAGLGLNPARVAYLKAGIPKEVPGYGINKACGSGLKAVALAAQAIASGDAEIVVAGGMENMSAAPYLLTKARTGYRMGHDQIIDSMISDGLTCPITFTHMGMTAENVAAKYEIARAEQDEFAIESQAKAAAAIKAGKFKEEIVAVEIPAKKGDPIRFETDEHPRESAPDKVAALKPAFKKDGSVTAASASGINDGAAAVVVMSEERARKLGLPVLASVRATAAAGVDPAIMGMGPWPASEKALEKAGLRKEEIDLWELNEAFAAQSLGVLRELRIPKNRVNVHGGAIALGHPIGASGARILVTLIHAMKDRDAKLGLASLCIGGGQGIAMIIER